MDTTKIQKNKIQSIIGNFCKLNGEIHFQNNLHIQGSFKGKIYSETGFLHVEEGTFITANIEVPHIVVYGRIKGNIQASKTCEVLGGEVSGDVKATSIRVAENVVLNGYCSMLC